MMPVQDQRLKHRRVLSEHQKTVFTLRVTKLWDWLAREVVVSISGEFQNSFFEFTVTFFSQTSSVQKINKGSAQAGGDTKDVVLSDWFYVTLP